MFRMNGMPRAQEAQERRVSVWHGIRFRSPGDLSVLCFLGVETLAHSEVAPQVGWFGVFPSTLNHFFDGI